VAAYLGAGGTVMIENYTGGSAWDFAVGAGGDGNAHVAGVGGSSNTSGSDDDETVTALGLANGFTQPPVLNEWDHQGYDTDFFAPLGFTEDFFTSDLCGSGVPCSALLSTGATLTGAAPEPASFWLIGAGLTGLGLLRRRITR
jgi:hypothetical protein